MNERSIQASLADRDARLSPAFDLVSPERYAALPRPGTCPAPSWKDRICMFVTDAELAAAGVTIDDVREAVEFYTASKPETSRHENNTATPFVSLLRPSGGWFVKADGYRAGPAGP